MPNGRSIGSSKPKPVLASMEKQYESESEDDSYYDFIKKIKSYTPIRF